MGNFQQLVIARRQLLGYSRAKLAKLAYVAESVIRDLEHNGTVPSLAAVKRICGILGIPITDVPLA